MIPALDPQQAALVSEARAFAEAVVKPGARDLDRTKAFPREVVRRAAEAGYLGCLIPRALDGRELGNVGQNLVLEEIAAACASSHVTISVHNSLVCAPIMKWGTEEQRKRHLPILARGEKLGAYLLTEPGSGSDAAAMKTTAVRDGDDFVINGDKMWITSGDEAQLGVLFARTDLDPKTRNTRAISAFVVDLTADGVTFGKRERKLGLRGSSTVAVFLKDVRVPATDLLDEVNNGFAVAMDTLNGGRIGIAVQAIGIARAALEATIEAARTLKSDGKPLAESQLTQFRVAEMATKIDAARLLAWRAASLRDQGLPHIKEASMAKLFASVMANEVCRTAVLVAGEHGYSDRLPLERLMRDARVTELYEGTTEVQKMVISKQVLGAG